jgi:hypothetical protein
MNTVLTIMKRYFEEGLKSTIVNKVEFCQLKKATKKHVVEIIALEFTYYPDKNKRLWLILLTG